MTKEPASEVPAVPCVGIFWHVEGRMVADRLPLADAEPYGDFLTSRGHYDVWEGWKKRGRKWLREHSMPEIISRREYEEFPRGRVVYDIANDLFVIYADRRLQVPVAVAAITRLFNLADAKIEVRSDSHYR